MSRITALRLKYAERSTGRLIVNVALRLAPLPQCLRVALPDQHAL